MQFTYDSALFAGYAVALACWLIAARMLPALWPRRAAPQFPNAWREVGWALLASVAVLGIGQLYTRGWLLPGGGRLSTLIEAANQLLIFSPILALPWLRGQGAGTAWLPCDRVGLRLLLGLALGTLAIITFTSACPGSEPWRAVWPRVYAPAHFGFLVQVLCEDVAVAILFVRLRAAMGLVPTALIVALLFAAGHIPPLLSQGATAAELARLGCDAALGVGILLVVQRSADVWWFWGVHFALDMMQFSSGASLPA